MNHIDFKTVDSVLSYNSESGEFKWKARRGSKPAESRAGHVSQQGYVEISINGKLWKAHRLAWLLSKGEMPDGQVDHINGVRDDNRLCNLRVVSHAGNCHNRRIPQHGNKTGFLGVSIKKGRYYAQIQINNKGHALGYFDSPEEAHEAYLAAKRTHHAECSI